MSSTSEPSSESPISRVPCDILLEIFTCCLPRYPLRYRQPNITIAPILLCHICSSWRRLALTSAMLWTHLAYRLTVVEVKNRDHSGAPKFMLVERDIEFIRWWKDNQGQIAPFLSLYSDIVKRRRTDITQKLTGDEMSFLIEYSTTAQFLDLDMFYWSQMYERIKAGCSVVFPNLHTLFAEYTWILNDPFYKVQTLLSNNALLGLRRLCINNLAPPNDFTIPNHWSTLTHVFLCLSISLEFWFSFIRTVPKLRWGFFDIVLNPTNTDYTAPPQCTLPELTTLFVTVRGALVNRLVFPLSSLFTNLHLPALHTLSLSSPISHSWANRRAITELYTVLKSTPAVTKLALRGDFLSFHTHDTAVILAANKGVEPVWSHVTQLVHLQLDLPIGFLRSVVLKEEMLDFVRNIFASDCGWLDLSNPACPIRSITISDNGTFDRIRNATMSRIQKYTESAPNLVFQIIPDPEDEIPMHERNEWGSRT